jgi:ubiquinone biosynthesis protein
MRISTLPQIYRHLGRWREIIAVMSKYGLAGGLQRLGVPFTKNLLRDRDGHALVDETNERRIRLALQELGPTFIKLGQVLSTRPDVLGFALANELCELQSNVAADAFETVQTTIEKELGKPLGELFAWFDPTPLASASIGQVHRATLHDGTNVVVKVQHAGISARIHVDLEILLALAQLAERSPELKLYRPAAMVAEFRRMLRHELDFERELRHQQQFCRTFADDPRVAIPQCFEQLTSPKVLTMEFLEGTPLAQLATRSDESDLRRRLARHGAELYLDMIFRHGRYHADPHPGNLLALADGRLGLLDFGMVGQIDDTLREDVEDMLMAIAGRDSHRLTMLVMRLGETPVGLDETLLEADLVDFVDQYAFQPIDKLDLSSALRDFVEIVRRYRVALPSSIAMLLKVVIMLEGTSRLLEPDFCLMELIAKLQRSAIRRRFSPLRQARKVRRIYLEVERLAEVAPRRLREILHQVQTGKFDVHLDHRGLEPSVNRLVLGMLASALFVGSTLLISRDVGVIYGVPVPGSLGAGVSVFLGFRLLRAISKSGRLDRREK